MKILNPGIIQVRTYEDLETEQEMYQFTITLQATVAIDRAALLCDAHLARVQAMETGTKMLEDELEKFVYAE